MRRDTYLASSRRSTRPTVPGVRCPTFRNSRSGRSPVPDRPAPITPADARRIRVAARALARAGLAHAYGHCSLRIDSEWFIVSPPKPFALIGAADSSVAVPTTGALPPDALPEVILHQHIYRRRGDVRGIARFQSPNLTALSTLGLTPRARHGFGAYFAPQAPLHADPRLVRDPARAAALVEQLGPA